jgi:hypothetical protein
MSRDPYEAVHDALGLAEGHLTAAEEGTDRVDLERITEALIGIGWALVAIGIATNRQEAP